jgi:uncharacterized protein (DUF4415 family)
VERTRRKPRPLTDAEEAVIQAGIAQDPDNPEWTEEDFARARPAREVLPRGLYEALVRESERRRSGGGQARRVSRRLDAEVVERLRAGGRGWQARANAILRKAVGL